MKRWAAMLVALMPLLARAQSLRGTVVDTAGRPLHYAMVRLLADSTFRTPALAQSSTDSAGRFAFDSVPAGARYVGALRIGFHRAFRTLEPQRKGGDTVRVVMGEYERQHAREDSLRAATHRERIAVARARRREWRCASGDSVAHARAAAAYRSFVATRYPGMRRLTRDNGMPSDSAGFVQAFLRPLSDAECARFAQGFDKEWGLETDSVEVYHFGRGYYLPWLGGYEGGFTNADGKILGVFIVPD